MGTGQQQESISHPHLKKGGLPSCHHSTILYGRVLLLAEFKTGPYLIFISLSSWAPWTLMTRLPGRGGGGHQPETENIKFSESRVF